jgi:hypothetical protein
MEQDNNWPLAGMAMEQGEWKPTLRRAMSMYLEERADQTNAAPKLRRVRRFRMRKQIQAGASMAYASADENEQQIADRRRASGVDSVVRMDAWSRKSRHAHELCIQSEVSGLQVQNLI